MQLQGKTILLTGGTAGIGQQLAHQLRALGAIVVVTGRSAEGLDWMRSLGFEAIAADLSIAAGAQAILDAMPERGRGQRGQKRATVSQTKARLRVIYWTGLSHKQLMRLRPRDVDRETKTLWVERRRKGKGAKAHSRPLTDEALAAFYALDAADAWGPFSASAMRTSFLRACAALGLEGLRPYDLRHSTGTDIYAVTGDLKAVQEGLGHADIRTSMRYIQGAVSPVIAAAMQKVSALRAAGALERLARGVNIADVAGLMVSLHTYPPEIER